jgi:AraC-like DNA-binding protein
MPDNSSSNPLDSTTPFKLDLPQITEWHVLAAIKLMQENLAHDYRADDLAEKLNISASYLCALFTKHVGTPLKHFQKDLRLTAAHHLFVTECLTVAEVMKRTGFRHLAHFNKDFKSKYGILPGQFRKECQKRKYSTSL